MPTGLEIYTKLWILGSKIVNAHLLFSIQNQNELVMKQYNKREESLYVSLENIVQYCT